ncbi:MAG: hypothetical protein JJE30_06015 [Desulfuromonadales bacterium]|nr:hypothetical protein [Desulfuromonadales bacterium]
MNETLENLNCELLQLQALLNVMAIAAEKLEGTQHTQHHRDLIYWGGVYDLAKGLVEKALEYASDLEMYCDKEEATIETHK